MRKQLAALLVAPILAISSAQAADAVRWDDLPNKIQQGRTYEYTVTAKDGKTGKGAALKITSKGVQIGDSTPIISREDIAEIRIHHHQRMSDAAGTPTGVVFAPLGEGSGPLLLLVIPVVAGFYAATAPPAIAVEGIRRMLPDNVIKVAP